MNFLKNLVPKKKASSLVGAVDLGSNSFHLLIGKIKKNTNGIEIITIDNLKSPVKLASGLNQHKILDDESKKRALLALKRFAERLRALSPDFVRAVATNTFRVAKNGSSFLKKCEEALGFPIEVISGVEEARLIYNGISNTIGNDDLKRLVIDIGGGSTEFVIGKNAKPLVMESVFVGCIKISKDFFPNGKINATGFSKAVFFSRKEIQVITSSFKSLGWDITYGCSGTVKSIQEVLLANQIGGGILNLQNLESLANMVVSNKSCDVSNLNGVKADRVNIFYGGLAILIAVFKELKIIQMELSNAALRLGVLYDVAGGERDRNIRKSTIKKFIDRYDVDRVQSNRINKLAIYFWSQFSNDINDDFYKMTDILNCATMLLEIGHSISHNSYHKHSSYLVSNSDMSGFSRGEQQLMSKLILGHVGKLAKVVEIIHNKSSRRALVCIRLASIFARSRIDLKPPKMILLDNEDKFVLNISENWLKSHPLTLFTLEQETKEWKKFNRIFTIKNLTEI